MQSTSERFWSKVSIATPEECWPWKGYRDIRGYGRFGYNRRSALAHRVSWELANGRCLPDGLVARHTCDNPGCVNPRHILSGTQADNHADMMKRGRNANQLKTHCKYGHPFSGSNLRERKDGARSCKACGRAATAKWKRNR